MSGERTILRPSDSAPATRHFGNITASVGDGATVEVTHQRFDAAAATDTGRTYTCRNVTGNAITVVGSKRVFFYFDADSKQWLIDGFVC